MSSTYSTNLRTELIGSGDQAGTWGNTTNTSLGSILEQAIAGVSGGPYISGTYPAVNFPTDADITLTANNGSVDQSRSMVLVITSSGSLTATRNVIAPASASKVYIIKNSTTGGQSIQIKYSTGTGVTIGNAQTMVVYGDGTNFYNGETALTNLTVNGNLAVSGNETISGTLAVTGATTFTGIPSGPTAGAGTNTTQLATTAFVTNATGTLGTMATQNANSVTITGGTINGVTGTNSGMTVGTATNITASSNTSLTSLANLVTVGTITSGTWSGSFGAVSGANLTSITGANVTGTVANATNLVSSGTIASNVTATTQSAGTSNTTVATTAFATTAIQALYPIGSIYTSTVSTNPNTLFGFGTWVAFGAGRVMIGNGGGFSAGATGGSADATLVSHSHTASSSVSDPSHSHSSNAGVHGNLGQESGPFSSYAGYGSIAPSQATINAATTGITVSTSISTEGSSATNANLPPYIVVYMWNRTA